MIFSSASTYLWEGWEGKGEDLWVSRAMDTSRHGVGPQRGIEPGGDVRCGTEADHGWHRMGCQRLHREVWAGLGWVAVSGAQQVERIDPRASVGARLRQVLSSWIAVEGVCGRRARFEARRRTRPRRAPRVFERDRAAPWRARRACRRGRRRGRRAPTTPSCGWRGAGEVGGARCEVRGVWSGVRALRHYV